MKRLIWIFSLTFLIVSPVIGRELMLPMVYTKDVNIKGWLMSEKLDGVRGLWTGKELRSKNGVLLSPPAAFLHNFPPFPVEGELWGGRGTFTHTISVVNSQVNATEWLNLKFGIFDVPEAEGGFVERITKAKRWFAAHPSRYAFVIEQKSVTDPAELEKELAHIESLGGEGLVVRSTDELYIDGRSTEVLKVKSFLDAEAKVLKHVPGKGRNAGRLGALLVEEPDGTRFKLGGGFSDAERLSPPPIGSIVTFKYYGKYSSGKPRFPVFLRLRVDAGL